MISINVQKFSFSIQEMKIPYGQILCIPISLFFALIKAVRCVLAVSCRGVGHMSRDVTLVRRGPAAGRLRQRTLRCHVSDCVKHKQMFLLPGKFSFLQGGRIINSFSYTKPTNGINCIIMAYWVKSGSFCTGSSETEKYIK